MLLLPGCDAGHPEWCASDPGVSTVVATRPIGWQSPPELELLWRVDGSEPGVELVLPSSVSVSPALDLIAIVDFVLGEVLVLSLQGEWFGRWGARGDGPGEIRSPVAAVWRDRELLVHDVPNSKLVVFDGTGRVTDEIPVDADVTATLLASGIVWISLASDGTLLVRPGTTAVGAESVVLTRASVTTSRVDTLLQVPVPMVNVPEMAPIPAPDWALPLAAVSPEGTLALAGEIPQYRIDLHSADATIRICRDVPALAATGRAAETPPSVPVELITALESAPKPDQPARIGRLQFDAVERLWVQRDRPGGVFTEDETIGREAALFDVYDASGSFLGEVQLPERTRFLGATDDLIITLERNELDVFSVAAYRPRW